MDLKKELYDFFELEEDTELSDFIWPALSTTTLLFFFYLLSFFIF